MGFESLVVLNARGFLLGGGGGVWGMNESEFS